MTAFARYWIASIVWPWRPMSIPRSGPTHDTVIVSSSSSSSMRAVMPIPSMIRCTSSRASPPTSLSLGDDLEANRGLVETGLLPLELPQRRPLGLADRLAGRLDLEIHQRRAFFLRFTRRGGALGFAAAGAPAPSSRTSFGGVREERFGPVGGATFGISRLVISPCPTVHRLVVIQ